MLPPTVAPSEGEGGEKKKGTNQKHDKKTSKNHARMHPDANILLSSSCARKKIRVTNLLSFYKESCVLLTLKPAKILTDTDRWLSSRIDHCSQFRKTNDTSHTTY